MKVFRKVNVKAFSFAVLSTSLMFSGLNQVSASAASNTIWSTQFNRDSNTQLVNGTSVGTVVKVGFYGSIQSSKF